MSTVKVRNGRVHSVKVIATAEQKNYISNKDVEMDARATQAVKAAVAKAEFCKKPVARYDVVNKKAYVEYEGGVKHYVD